MAALMNTKISKAFPLSDGRSASITISDNRANGERMDISMLYSGLPFQMIINANRRESATSYFDEATGLSIVEDIRITHAFNYTAVGTIYMLRLN
jgi:hypothetical protein